MGTGLRSADLYGGQGRVNLAKLIDALGEEADITPTVHDPFAPEATLKAAAAFWTAAASLTAAAFSTAAVL